MRCKASREGWRTGHSVSTGQGHLVTWCPNVGPATPAAVVALELTAEAKPAVRIQRRTAASTAAGTNGARASLA